MAVVLVLGRVVGRSWIVHDGGVKSKVLGGLRGRSCRL